jgi:hypothetical protein
MKKVVLGALTALMTLCVQSQELPTIIPPSPEAASLGKFTEVPVSHYTGVPNISIPIYTINAKGISIPIGLSYHARGIQVGEMPSKVGLGWALSYGGSMSRQIRDNADESAHGYFNNASTIDGALASTTARQTIGTREADDPFTYDTDPDKFIYNANGTSGNFFFNYKDLKPLINKYGDVKITHFMVNGEIDRFEVIDANGVTYYFGKSKDGSRVAKNKEQTIVSYVYSNQIGAVPDTSAPIEGPFPNSWQLMDIETLDGDLIEFHYLPQEITYFRRSNDQVNMVTNQPESRFSKIRSTQYHISEIIFKTGKVKFYGGATGGLNTMERIEVLDKNNVLIKKVQLGYEYKTAVTNGNELPYLLTSDPDAKKRLYLKTVQEFDGNGVSVPAHSFTYSTQELPSRFSNSQDSWGYYNGANNGHYMTFFGQVNRAVDTTYAEAGMLKKITYPTGGSTHFTYEHNKVIPSQAMKDIVISATNPIVSRDEVLSNLHYATNYNQTTGVYEKQFEVKTIYATTSTGIDATVNIQVPTAYCGANEPNQSACNFSITLTKNGGTPIQLYNGSNTIGHASVPPGIYTLQVTPQNHVHDHTNPNHFFQVSLNWIEQESSQSDILYAAGKRIKRVEFRDADNALVSYKEYDYRNPSSGLTSGKLFGLPSFHSINHQLTFGNVTVLQPNGSSTSTPLSAPQGNNCGYEYVTEYIGDPTNNIGKVQYRFTTTLDYGVYYNYPFILPINNEWLRGKPLDIKYFKNTNGSYSLQKESINDYLYADVISGGASAPFIFNAIGANLPIGGLLPIAASITDPLLTYLKTTKRYRLPLVKVTRPLDPNTGVPDPFGALVYRTYHLTGGTLDLKKTTTKDYYDNGVVFTTITENSFDYDKHYQLKTTKVTDSNGDVIETKNYYPADVRLKSDLGYDDLTPQELSAILKMKAPDTNNLTRTHQVATPVQVETKKNAALVSTLRTNFFIDTNNSDMVLPKNVETLKGTYEATNNPLEERIVYHSYYDNGNVQEVSKTDGTHIVYIWGYDRTVPIAKIENATYNDIPAPLYNSILAASNADNDRTEGASGNEGALRTELAKLSNATEAPNLTAAQITTFTYDPLVGVTSITDPRGRTIYYIYDSFNRLKYVKDHDGNVLSENEYNYKN